MTRLLIDNKIQDVWRCQSRSFAVTSFRRVRSIDLCVPDKLVPSSSSGPSYHLEFVLADRILICWTASLIEAADVEEIDTVVKLLYLKSGDAIPCRITDRKPNDQEREFIQQERLIESNHAIAAAISAAHQPPEKKAQPALAPPEINDTLLWHVQQTLSDQLDPKLKSAPSASLVFICYCRDKMTLAEMHRRFHWPIRTLKLRKATLQAFLRKQFNLELAAFFVDRSIFGAAERQLADHRARHISPRALADGHDPQDEA